MKRQNHLGIPDRLYRGLSLTYRLIFETSSKGRRSKRCVSLSKFARQITSEGVVNHIIMQKSAIAPSSSFR